jgi:outer membrane protein assembly factor BamB
MSDGVEGGISRRIELGEIDPCGSRQAGRRSGVTLTADGPVVGRADGTVRAFDGDGTERWLLDGAGSTITLVPFADGVLVGERSARGGIRVLADGTERWRHDAAEDIGEPTEETRFLLPMIVDAAVAGDTAYVAARRYERPNGGRQFESSVYAFDPDGDVRWRYDADASPISLSIHDGGVAVAYNRCPGEHDDGLVVLGADGATRWTWDPDRTATRRVGDVASLGEEIVVTSHADYRGYRLTEGGIRWQVDLGRPLSDGDEVYTYPNHVAASDGGIVFVTGNSFPKEGRETDERHPNEQAAVGYSLAGEEQWRANVGGFCHGIAVDDDRTLVPVAQHFRDREPSVHGYLVFDPTAGVIDSVSADGVLTAAALDGERRALIEEPVSYHDDDTVRGSYTLWVT